MKSFKQGRVNILIATDVASRGIGKNLKYLVSVKRCEGYQLCDQL